MLHPPAKPALERVFCCNNLPFRANYYNKIEELKAFFSQQFFFGAGY